jgi:hypothetical protein
MSMPISRLTLYLIVTNRGASFLNRGDVLKTCPGSARFSDPVLEAVRKL